MRSNIELQHDVQEALRWEPLLDAAEIGVIVKEGIVTLTGTVDSYAKKSEAEHAAKSVSGVMAVIENIELILSKTSRLMDVNIANEIVSALKWNWEVPNNKVRIRVENGWVTLEGELHWNRQREAAKNSVSRIAGVKGITNSIIIKPKTNDQIEKEGIEQALLRNGSVDSRGIRITISNNKVTLEGIVHSWFQKDEAGRIAWNALGVWEVDNRLIIEDSN